MKHTGQDSRATQQKQTACLMLDQQLKLKSTAHCPSYRDFKTTLMAVEMPATTPVGSLTMTTRLSRQRRLIGGYNPRPCFNIRDTEQHPKQLSW